MEKQKQLMQEMHPKSSEGNKKEMPIKVETKFTLHGQYAVEIPDELPPLDSVKFINEQGRFIDTKIPTKEDLAYWYRKKLRLVGALVALAGITLLLIMLSATTKYADGVWEFGLMTFSFIIDFIMNLLPESVTNWLPI